MSDTKDTDVYIPTLKGPKISCVGDINVYEITNFSNLREYPVSTDYGLINVQDNKVHFTPSTEGEVSFTVCDREVKLKAMNPGILTPSIKVIEETVTDSSIVLESSPIEVLGIEDTLGAADWEISLFQDFHQVMFSSYKSNRAISSWEVIGLSHSQTYYARVRYYGKHTTYISDWSKPTVISTAQSPKIARPKVIAPTKASNNVCLSTICFASKFESDMWKDDQIGVHWELSTKSDFSENVISYSRDVNFDTGWHTPMLFPDCVYYLRVRFKGVKLGWSDWSETCFFRTETKFVEKPSIVFPDNYASHIPPNVVLKSSDYYGANSTPHTESSWQLSEDPFFTSIVEAVIASPKDLLSWKPTKLQPGITYYARVRHIGYGQTFSRWSDTVEFKVCEAGIEKPSFLSPVMEQEACPTCMDIILQPYFAMSGVQHESTSWELGLDNEFKTVSFSSYEDKENLHKIKVDLLAFDTDYYVRAKFHSEKGCSSCWSDPVRFRTLLRKADCPAILFPSNGALDMKSNLCVMSSKFNSPDGLELDYAEWQLSSNLDFNTYSQFKVNPKEDDHTKLSLEDLEKDSTHYVRVRHITKEGIITPWSDTVGFTVSKDRIYAPVFKSPQTNDTVNPEEFEVTLHPMEAKGTHHLLSTDWEVSLDSQFQVLIYTSYKDSVNKTKLLLEGFEFGKLIYIRARYNASSGLSSTWSVPLIVFTKSKCVNKPVFKSPEMGVVLEEPKALFVLEDFTSQGNEYHLSTDWELATDVLFKNVVSKSSNNFLSLKSWGVGSLEYGNSYYVRARYRSTSGLTSPWSDVFQFSIVGEREEKPSILEPLDGSNGISLKTIVKISPSKNSGKVFHESSETQVSLTSDFSEIFFVSRDDPFSKEIVHVDKLPYGQTFYVRTRYVYSNGKKSAWSDSISFSTVIPRILRPVISSSKGEKIFDDMVCLTSSAFTSVGELQHQHTEWEVSLDSSFRLLIDKSYTTDFLDLSLKNILCDVFVRVQYTASTGEVSEWSPTFKLTRCLGEPKKPVILYPEDNSLVPTSNFLQGKVKDFEAEGPALLGSIDWEIASDPHFAKLVDSGYEVKDSPQTFITDNLRPMETFYCRVRYNSTEGVKSPWSDTVMFFTSRDVLDKPKIYLSYSDNENVPLNVDLKTTFETEKLEHIGSEWEVYSDETMETLITRSNDHSLFRNSFALVGLDFNKTYYARVRHFSLTGGISPWSDLYVFKTMGIKINQPVIQVPLQGENISEGYLIVSSPLQSEVQVDHESTDWEIAIDEQFKTLVHQEVKSKKNLNMCNVTKVIPGIKHYIRVRYHAKGGAVSDWSPVVQCFA